MGLLAILLLGLVLGFTLLTLYTARSLTRPPRRTYATALAQNRPGEPNELPDGPRGPRQYEAWTLSAHGHTLPVWDLTGDDPAGPLLIMTHGWSDSRIGALWRARALLPLCSRIIMWDLPAHGEAGGSCTLGLREPRLLLALLDHIAAPTNTILYGWSMGAGISIAAAADHACPPLRAVIAEAPYRLPLTPARNVLDAAGLPYRLNLPLALACIGALAGAGPRWNRPRPFDRAHLARDLRAPLLILHGQLDTVCPLADGQAIAAAAPRATCVTIPNAGHFGLYTDPDAQTACVSAIRALLANLNSPAPDPAPLPTAAPPLC